LLGAKIKLTSFDETFTSIVSNNKWTTYTFYINPDSTTTTYLELCLGDENALVNGNVYFGNITFTSDVSNFNKIKENETTKILNKTAVKDDDSNTKTESDKKKEKTDVNWFYFASSIIFAVAIVVCVVGVMLKKIKWKKPSKKTKNAYDRNKTVSKQYYMRKAVTIRENKLHELEKDLETLHNERVQYEEEYKHDLTLLRELKRKRASADEIKKLEKDMKKNQKLSAGIGVTINRVQDEINFVKTDAFLNVTIKKLSTQAPEKQNEEENK